MSAWAAMWWKWRAAHLRCDGVSAYNGTEPFVLWPGVFSDAELDRIVAYGDALQLHDATVKTATTAEGLNSVRSTKVAFFDQVPDIKWLYEKMSNIVFELNRKTYQFELFGMERFQYTVYNQGGQDHYGWHMDQGHTKSPRKLSLVLQLSPPTDYEGCNLEIQPSAKIETMPRERGTLIAFPAYIVHRVTPIQSGVRRSLVIWCNGPRFR
jgi:PKHD-type hydroxylase